jgi:hypothetical protein
MSKLLDLRDVAFSDADINKYVESKLKLLDDLNIYVSESQIKKLKSMDTFEKVDIYIKYLITYS